MKAITRGSWLVVFLCVLVGCSPAERDDVRAGGEGVIASMDEIARGYVQLVLALGRHDAAYVDAYYGPPEWSKAAEATAQPLAEIRDRATELVRRLETDSAREAADELVRLRHRYLRTQLGSLLARVEMLDGARLSFDEESRALYDAVAPSHGDEHYQAILDELEPLLPGDGPLTERYAEFRNRFVIAPDKLDAVFRAAIEACRTRTRQFIDLPADENFEVEYVTDKSWSAYNWYQGGFHSLIQVNTDLPIYIDRAIDLACHEGYPGHHVYNVLLERHLVRERNWVEFSIYPLFSPQSLIAEGTANYGIRMAFPGHERARFEAETLFPLAGLDPAAAGLYYDVLEKAEQLAYAGNEAARAYLDGRIDARAAADRLVHYSLMTPDRAEQRVRFVDEYRSYVINYNLGQDMVGEYLEARAGNDPVRRWAEFTALLSSPRLPSGLR